ncbi:MAG: hypothetical protein Q7J28_04355 [Caulobacter sp.]|nr:hypothetical protein [Caulobacter sp.]
MRPAVVLGLSPTGLYAIRELGQAGVPVLGVAAEPQTASRSRYLTHGPGRLVEPDETRRLQRLLDLFPADQPAPVLIPTSDQDIDFVIRHAETLRGRFLFQDSYVDGVCDRVFGKAPFYAACREFGLDAPAYLEAPVGELTGLRDRIVFPCLVKPSEIHAVKDYMAGRKVLIARTLEAFDAIIAALPPTPMIWVVQEIVPGPESNITLWCAYLDREGQPRQAFTARKLRQFPPGFGSASLVASAPEEETRALSERLLTGIGFRGIAAAEFKRDPRDGRLKAIEVNARPSLWFAVSTASGRKVTLAAYRDLAGEPPPPETPQLNGVRWRYILKDAWAALFYLRSRDFILPAPDLTSAGPVTGRVYPVLDLSDLRPTLDELLNYGGKFLRRLRPKTKSNA